MEDYLSAAVRHWESSWVLQKAGCIQDGAYLAGYVGECTLKACLKRSGNTELRSYSHDISILSKEGIELAWLFIPLFQRYRLPSLINLLNWKAEFRYAPTDVSENTNFNTLIEEAYSLAQELLIPMVLDGYFKEIPL
ncbi:MAG: hypothetical protein WHT84_04500 [Breznakiellaceae bacterium]